MYPPDSKKTSNTFERLTRGGRVAQLAWKSFDIKMIEQLNSIQTQLAKTAIADHEKIIRMVKPLALDIVNSSVNQLRMDEGVFRNSLLQTVQGLEKLNKSVFKSMRMDSSSLTHISRSIQSDIMTSSLAGINSMMETINRLNTFPNIYKELGNSFSIKLFRELERKDITFSNAVDSIEGALTEKAETLPPSLISSDGILSLLFSFIFFIVAMVSSQESEERIIGRMEQLEITILEQVEKLIPVEDSNVYYIAIRPVNLRTKPSTIKSSTIAILHPNQRVELLQRKGKWIYVRYFDYLEGVPKTGWVYKKYLKMVR